MRKTFYFLLLAIGLSQVAFGQLTGIKTIPGSYATITAAVTALNASGVGAGGVTFNVAAGYTETLTARIDLTATGTSTNPIIFQKSGAGANPVVTSYAGTNLATAATPDGMWSLTGSDYVTIDGINLLEAATNNTPALDMEYGYGLFKASGTDGANNNTIKNCTITLNRDNNTAPATGPFFQGSIGIAVMDCSPVTATANTTVTASSGASSNNKFYSNTIQNVNCGIAMTGYTAPTPYTLGDTGNDIGGSAAGTGNSIINFGGGAAATNACAAVFVKDQWSPNVSYNTVNNNTGAGINHVTTNRGIWLNSSSTGASATVNNNTVTINGAGTTTANYNIDVETSSTVSVGNTVSISNNVIQNSTFSTATSGVFYGIYLGSGAATVNITGNSITGFNYPGTGASYIIYNAVAGIITLNVTNNTVSNHTFASTGTVYGLYNATSMTNYNVTGNTFSNFNKAGASGTMYGMYVGSPTNGNISNNIFDGFNWTLATSTGSTYGIYDISSGINVTYNNNIIRNFTTPVTGTLYGIREFGSAGVKKITNNQIYNFQTTAGGAGGFTFYGLSFLTGTIDTISGNSVYNINSAGTTGGTAGIIYCIYSSSGTTNYFYKNSIYNISSNSTGPAIYGFYIAGATTNNIFNNFISDIRAPFANAANPVNGIYVSSGTTENIYYNTIYLNAVSTGAIFGSTGIYAATGYSVDLRNNIVINTSTANTTGLTVAYRRSSTTLTSYAATSNNNDFFAGTPSATNVIMNDGTASYQTLAAYKTLVSPRDVASITENPPFVNVATTPYDLHMKTTIATQCESGGVVVASPIAITSDYDAQSRYPNTGYPNNITTPASAPDMGADEFGGLILDLSPPLVSFTQFANTSATTARTLTTTITDGTGVPTSGSGLPRLYWKINAGSWQTAIATYVSGSTYTFTYGAGVVLGDVVSYYIVAQDIVTPTPNVGATPGVGAAGFTFSPPAAATPPTTPYSYTIVASLCGNYNVGVGQTYTTLTAAINDVLAKELTCAVTLTLKDATYTAETFPIIISPIAGSSSVNTLTIKPGAGVTASITGSSTSGAIVFFGCQNVIIDGSNSGGTDQSLTIQNTNVAASCYTLGFFNNGTVGASNCTVKNCNVLQTSQVTVNNWAIILNAAGGGYNNIVINNNHIYSAYYGLQFAGIAGAPATNGQITNNVFGSATDATALQYRGILLGAADNTLIQGNDIYGAGVLGNANYAQCGIVLTTGATNTRIKQNKIHDWWYNGTGGWGNYGIYFGTGDASTPTEITNNLIYNIKTDGYALSVSTYNLYGIWVSSGGNLKIYHNSINLQGNITSSSTANWSACIAMVSGTTLVDMRDNILKNSLQPISGTPASKTYAVINGGTATTFSSTNYNDYFVNGIGPNIGYQTADQATLAAWQAATTQDANSISIDPVFVSGTDLHASAAGLAKTGVFLPTVPADFAGTSRTDPPDMGAYQFSANQAVVTVAATAITTTTATLNGTINASSATVTSGYDYGLTVAYGSSVAGLPVTVTGSTNTPFAGAVSALAPGTLYHYRAKGISGGVTVYGSDLTFTTQAIPPTVVTTAATLLTSTTATVNGTVNANGFSTTVSFDYGLTVAYGTNVPGVPLTITGSTVTASLANLTGLLPNTTYHFRINGTNLGGTVNGGDLTFTTATAPPTVTTTAATPIGTTTATLNGIVNANNSSTTVFFDYGLTVAYGTTVAGVPSPVTGSANTNVSAAITGLVTNTTYHFRVRGANVAGTSNGIDLTFLTGCPQPGAAGTVTGPVNVCKNGTGYVYTVPVIANATTYTWSLPTGATITAGANTNSITVSFSGVATSGNVSVIGSSVCGTGTGSPNLAVTVNAQPTPTITGAATVCALSTGNVYTTQTGMTGYTWTTSAGGTVTAGTGTSSATVTWTTAGAQSVNVNYNNANGCSATTPVAYPVTVNALPVPTIAGPASACVNSTTSVYTTQTGMTGYTWTVSAGGTITSGGTTNAITVTWGTTGAKTVTVNYTNASSCTAASASSYAVTVNALPTPTITGSATVCQGTTGVVYTTQTGMTGYVWTVSAGGIVTGGGTATSNTVTVIWNNSGAQTVSVNYANANGCVAAAATSYTVTVNPTPVPTIGSNNAPCVGSTGNMYYTEGGMTGYVWTVSAGGAIVSGQGTSAINVTWTGVGAQTVTVNYTNATACTATTATVYNLFVNPMPNAAGAITGTATLCAGTNGVAYSCGDILNASTYTWTLPAGATIATGAGTRNITVNFGVTAVSGNITVSGTNSCGNGTSSPAFAVTVNPLPAAAGTITGPASVCVGSTGVAYSVPAIANATTYVWTVPAGATITSGGTTRNIVVTYGSAAGTGTVTVKGTNTCGNGAVASLNVTMNAIPSAPVVTVSGAVLTSSAVAGNQWYFEGTAIAGATGQSYTVTHNTGYYWCVVTTNGCSSPLSNKVWIVVTGIGSPAHASQFVVYPNPSSGKFTVSMDGVEQGTYTIEVTSNLGVTIWKTENVAISGSYKTEIDIRPAPTGVYMVLIRNNDSHLVRKVMVNN